MRMRIIFVGVHNKPGKEPLDSSTRTGKIIDRIIVKIKEVEPETYIIKSNLYDIDYFPSNRTKALDIEWVHNWMERIMWDEFDIIVTLGHCVNECFRWAKVKSIKVGHPSAIWSIEGRNQYINNVFDKIGIASAFSVSATTERSDEYLRSQGLDPEQLGREGAEFVNNLLKKYHNPRQKIL